MFPYKIKNFYHLPAEMLFDKVCRPTNYVTIAEKILCIKGYSQIIALKILPHNELNRYFQKFAEIDFIH